MEVRLAGQVFQQLLRVGEGELRELITVQLLAKIGVRTPLFFMVMLQAGLFARINRKGKRGSKISVQNLEKAPAVTGAEEDDLDPRRLCAHSGVVDATKRRQAKRKAPGSVLSGPGLPLSRAPRKDCL